MYKTTLFVTLLLLVTSLLMGQNLITNGDFSSWTDSSPDNWTLSGSSISVIRENSSYYDSPSSAALNWSTSTTRYLYQIIDVDPSTQYYCECWFYDNDPGGRGRIYFTWMDENEDNISSQGSSDYTEDGTNWVKKSYTAISPENAVKLRVELRCYDVTGWDGDADLLVDACWVNLGDDFLPVTLSSFSAAVYLNQYVSVQWVTQSESNLSHFNVYRDQLLIDSQMATNSCCQTNYTFIDQEVIEGNIYNYSLEIVELDGTTNLYGPYTVTVQFTPEDDDPNPQPVNSSELEGNYPNPFNPDTTIQFTIADGEIGCLSIYNVKGQQIMEEIFPAGKHAYHWEAADADSGIYFYKLETPTISKSQKMILIK